MYAQVVSFFLLVAVCSAQLPTKFTAPIPILNEDPGIRLDPSSVGAQIKLEAFIELNCPDSEYSWPILKELQEEYGPENIDIVIHHVPLPYHRQAFLCTEGFNVIRALDPDNAIAYIDHIFDNNLRFGNLLTRNQNELEIIDVIASLAADVTDVTEEDFVANMTGNAAYGDTIRAWKYGTRRNVAGTPWFWINNVDLAINPSIRLSYDDWTEILDPIFGIDESDKDVANNNEKEQLPAEIDEDAVRTPVYNKNKINPVHQSILKVDSNIKIFKKH